MKNIPFLKDRQIPRLGYHTRLQLMLLPYFLAVFLLVIIPAIFSFFLAFFRYNALSAPVWVGYLNFILVYTDELFTLSIQNSLALIVLPVPLRVMGAFLLARLLQYPARFLHVARLSVFLPSVIPSAAYALAWLWILNPRFGPLNLLLQAGGMFTPNWFADPLWAKPALVLMSLWQVGEGFLVCLAALQDIPATLDEAATIDGASPNQRFWYITLPLMAPILLLLSFRDVILSFQESFTAILLTTNGGPYYATYTLPLFIYEQGFDLLAFGQASAALWVMYVLTGLIIFGLYLIAQQWNIGSTDETFFF